VIQLLIIQFSTPNQVNLPHLPVEVITKIIINLTDINDIKNCMQVSKDVNSFIFRTPEIMKKLKFKFDCSLESDEAESLKYLKIKGSHVKNMQMCSTSKSIRILRTFLRQTPNLVELSFHNHRFANFLIDGMFQSISTKEQDTILFNEYWTPKPNSIDLPDLKVLEMEVADLYNFMKVTKQVKMLEKLKINIQAARYQKIMTEFILKQDNLKELAIEATNVFEHVYFPTRNINNDVKFRLKRLKIKTMKEIHNEFFDRFLETQADSLEEIYFQFRITDSTMDVVFNKLKNLKKYTQKFDQNDWSPLDQVTYYRSVNNRGLKLNKISSSFPNLISFKCHSLLESDGIFSMLSLDVLKLDISNLINARFVSLTKLTISKLMDVRSENCWLKFVKNIKNVDNLSIEEFENIDNLSIILKSLKTFKTNLKFCYRNCSLYSSEETENEIVQTGCEFHKITVDMKEKTVKVSTFIVKKLKEILTLLTVIFKDFEFFEFCFDMMKMEKINVNQA